MGLDFITECLDALLCVLSCTCKVFSYGVYTVLVLLATVVVVSVIGWLVSRREAVQDSDRYYW